MKISARLMLWIEAASVTVIVIVVALLLVRHGWHLDPDQLHLRGMTGSGLRLGLVLALFSFVGFESATTLGSEARNPLQTIPRAVIQSAVLAGAFFTICAYAEVLGFHIAGQDLGASQAPMYVLAPSGRRPGVGTADRYRRAREPVCWNPRMHHGGRTRIAADGAQRARPRFSERDSRSQSNTGPGRRHHRDCCAASGRSAGSARRQRTGRLRLARFPGDLRFYRGLCSGLHCACRATCATTASSSLEPQIVPWLAGAAMLLALVGNFYPVPEGPYGKLPYVYLAYLAAGLLWFAIRSRGKDALSES